MPYIDPLTRDHIDAMTCLPENNNAGQLNYSITKLIKNYMDEKGKSYQAINDIIGALEGAKAEFYRRVAGPYEDTKIKENGDVY